MPNASYLNNQKPDRFTLHMDGSLAPGFVSFTMPKAFKVKKLTTASTGVDPIGTMVVGSAPDGEIIFNSTTEADLRAFLGIGAGVQHNHPVGTILTKKELRFHPADLPDAERTGDIYLLYVSLGGINLVSDGTEEERRYAVPYYAHQDPVTGRVWRIGEPEA